MWGYSLFYPKNGFKDSYLIHNGSVLIRECISTLVERVQFILTWVFGILWWKALNTGLAFLKSQRFISRVLFQMFYWKYFFSSRCFMGESFYSPFYFHSLPSCFWHPSLLTQFRNLNCYHITGLKQKSPKGATVCNVYHLPSFHYGHTVAWSFKYLMVFFLFYFF